MGSRITEMFAEQLRRARQDRHLSQQAAAEQIGCSIGAIRAWEAATRTPTGKYRADLEAWLKVTSPPRSAGR